MWQTVFAVVGWAMLLAPPAVASEQIQAKRMLNEPGMKLFNEVERLYGRSVSVVWSDTKKGTLGVSEVSKDGTPVIVIQRGIQDPATTLLHELFHLKERFHGIPAVIRPENMKALRAHITVAQLAELFALVKDTIAHTRFYSDMRAMGYAPTAAFTSALPQQIVSFRQAQTPESHIRRTLMLIQAHLESDDQQLVDVLKRDISAAGGTIAVAEAEELAGFIRDNKPTSVDEFVTVFVKVTNHVLQPHKIRLEALPVRWEWRGRLRDPVVTIRALQL